MDLRDERKDREDCSQNDSSGLHISTKGVFALDISFILEIEQGAEEGSKSEEYDSEVVEFHFKCGIVVGLGVLAVDCCRFFERKLIEDLIN